MPAYAPGRTGGHSPLALRGERWLDPAMAPKFPASLAAIPGSLRVDPLAHPPRVLIGGDLRRADGPGLPVHSAVATADGGPVLVGYQADTSPAQAAEAVVAAASAYGRGFGPWPASSPETRVAAVEAFAARMERRSDELSTLLMWEICKPLAAAKDEVTRTVEYIRETIAAYREMLREPKKKTFSSGDRTYVEEKIHKPLGVVVCAAPFNYPINELWTTVIPALLAGNTVVAKTPKLGVLANMALAEDAAACFPGGALSLLPGSGRKVFPALMSQTIPSPGGLPPRPAVAALNFIGSAGALDAVVRSHPAPGLLKTYAGLGAKNAGIVLPGADLAAVARAMIKKSLGYGGKRCTAEKRWWIPAGDLGRLLPLIQSELDRAPVGMPWEDGVAFAPEPEEGKVRAMWDLLRDARSKGARIANRGGGDGWHTLMRPAIVADVTPDMRLAHEEPFGPVLPLMTYDDLSEVIAFESASPFGQQASIFGPEDAAGAVAEAMGNLVARTNINTACSRGPDPFAFSAKGISGIGVRSVEASLRGSMSESTVVRAGP